MKVQVVRSQTGRRGSVLLLLLGLVLLLGTTLVGCFRVGGAAGAVRRSLVNAVGGEWDAKVQLSVGSAVFQLAGLGLACVDDLEPEVASVVRAMRGASVGVYEARSRSTLRPGEALARADAVMERRGWYRMVGVQEREDLVAVYTPAEADVLRDLRVCVVVLNPREMVVVSASCNPEPLLRLARRHLREEVGGEGLRLAEGG